MEAILKSTEKLQTWFVFALVFLIYLRFPTKNYYWDGVAFASVIEHAAALNSSLIHPNHLIYEVVGYLIYQVARAFGINLRAIEVLQIANSFLSVLAAYVLFRILSLSIRSTYLVWSLTLLFAFSGTWWKFSTDADAYIPSVLFLLVSFCLVLPVKKPRPFLLAILFSASVCLHQIAVIFFPVLILSIVWQSASRKERIANALKFGGLAFVITLATYLFCFYVVAGTVNPKSFVYWATSHAHDESVGFHPWSNLLFSLRGSVRLLFDGRFNLIKGLINLPITLLLIALAVAVSTMLRQFIVNAKHPDFSWVRTIPADPKRRILIFLCLVWSFVYVLFLYALLAPQTFYRMFYLPSLILSLGIVLEAYNSARAGTRKYRLLLFVAVVALSNFLFLIFPYSHVQKYKPLALAQEMNRVWPPGTVIYFATENSDNNLFSYFNPETVWKLMSPITVEKLDAEMQNVYGQNPSVWLDASGIDALSATPEGAYWLHNHGISGSQRQIDDTAYNIKFIRIVQRQK